MSIPPIEHYKSEWDFEEKPPIEYVQRWVIDEKIVTVYRNKDELTYEIFDKNTKQRTVGPLPIQGHSMDTAIFVLVNSQAIITNTGLTFVKRPPAYQSWFWYDYKVELLKNESEWFWDVSDEKLKTHFQLPFHTGVLHWEPLSKGHSNKYEKKFVNPSCPEYFEDSEITGLVGSCEDSLLHIEQICAEKIVGESKLDPSIPIDCLRWAVSLINSGNSFVKNPKSWAGHAAIIIEGRENGTFFIHKAHLREIEGVAKVILDKNINYNFPDRQKRYTWSVSRDNVKKMLDAVQWEITKQNETDPQVFFNISGAESILVKPIVMKRYRSYDHLINEELGPECLDPSLTPSKPRPLKAIVVDFNGKKKIITNEKFATEGEQHRSPHEVFILDSTTGEWIKTLLPDNCMTWAKKKLEICEAYFDDHTLNKIYASPNLHVTNGPEFQQKVSNSKVRKSSYYNRLTEEDIQDLTPLMRAIIEGKMDEVKNLLPSESTLNNFLTYCFNHEEVVNDDPRKKNKQGYDAFHLSCLVGDIRIVKLLLENGMNINERSEDPQRSTPLQLAIAKEDDLLVDFLLKKGAKFDQKDPITGNTLIHHLAGSRFRYGNVKVLEILIRHFISIDPKNINSKNNEGETPLIVAARCRNHQMVDLLLQSKASIDEEDDKGRTALWHACHNGDKEMVLRLIREWPKLLNYHSRTDHNPFVEARERNFHEIVELLQRVLNQQLHPHSIYNFNLCVVS